MRSFIEEGASSSTAGGCGQVDRPGVRRTSDEIILSGPAEWAPILKRLGISAQEAKGIEIRARLAGVPFQVELLASGMVEEGRLYRALADHLELPYVPEVRPESLFMREEHCLAALRRPGGIGKAAAVDSTGRTVLLFAPDRLDIPAMQRYLQRYPRIAENMRIAPPSVLRRAVRQRAQRGLARVAVHGLFEAMPDLSARFVLNSWQAIVLGAGAVLLVTALALAPSSTLLAIHCVLSLLFFSCVALRAAVSHGVRKAPPPTLLKTMRTEEMPVYTVLVALYKEADVVPDLLVALGKLVWPRSKLEVKLVCEADDAETLAAIRAQELRSFIEVIEVPPEGPRTKPKALSYALPMTTGEFLVLFDAEDRPHPFQLVEAWQRFRESEEDLACVQAPLVITNRSESWISSMFAFEYSALFHGILPWLAARGLVLPLGGTSNHFRRAVLEGVGGWDPCNVTEDADLGLRLARLGYKTGTITYPTYEDAPTSARIWLPQRTRWFKGWAQTWFVHMRDVPQLYRDLGPASFIVTQVLSAGMWISALAYAAFTLTIAALVGYLLTGGPLSFQQSALLVLDTVNVVFGHAAFLALGWWTLPKTERRGFWKHLLSMPGYWLLLSAAAWRALWQLYRCPHAWEKTPHRPSRRKGAGTQRRNSGPNPTTFASSSPIASMSRPA
jgi:cellulose synthase/poly-beta-1,6-N-acetylglucosamine synthase-like glycosyltransferase